jgi:hypothetical protein
MEAKLIPAASWQKTIKKLITFWDRILFILRWRKGNKNQGCGSGS